MVNTAAEAPKRDRHAARRRILDAAAGEFARHGFAGARVDRIARLAGLNKRMLYHYFGAKRGLYTAVLDDRLPAPPDPARPETLAGELDHRLARMDSTAARLVLWELLAPGRDERAAPLAGVESFAARIAEAQGDGRLPAELDAGWLAGLLLWGHAASQIEARGPPTVRRTSVLRAARQLQTLLRTLEHGARSGFRAKPRVRLKPAMSGKH